MTAILVDASPSVQPTPRALDSRPSPDSQRGASHGRRRSQPISGTSPRGVFGEGRELSAIRNVAWATPSTSRQSTPPRFPISRGQPPARRPPPCAPRHPRQATSHAAGATRRSRCRNQAWRSASLYGRDSSGRRAFLHSLIPTTRPAGPEAPRRAETPTRAPPAAAPRISSTVPGRRQKRALRLRPPTLRRDAT